MTRTTVLNLGLLVALSLMTGACGSGITTPTSTDTYSTDSFDGLLGVGETKTHVFTTKTSGSVNVYVSSLLVESTLQFGVGVGTWNASTETCTVQVESKLATQGSVFVASVRAPGDYCLALSDVGNFTVEMSYTVAVTHP